MRTSTRVFGMLLLVLAAPGLSQVVINEILFDPAPTHPAPANHQWVEIHNKGSVPVDLGGWTISNRDGTESPAAFRLPSVTIPESGYLVVHFAEGEGRTEFGPEGAHIYSGNSTNLWNPGQDAVALYSPAGIVDFLAWRLYLAPLEAGRAHADAVAAGIWQSGSALTRDFLWYALDERFREVRPGVSAGRDQASSDTNRPQDFEPNGGRDSCFQTPGRKNLESILKHLLSQGAGVPLPQTVRKPAPLPRRAEPMQKWTVLWYFLESNSTDQIAELLEVWETGGSTADVNFVIQFTTPASLSVRGMMLEQAPYGKLNLFAPDGDVFLARINQAAAASLKDFIAWGKANFPAERYTLIVSGGGLTWKHLGASHVDGLYDKDRLYPGELADALSGAQLDLLFLDTNFSAMAELAWQVRGSARFLVANFYQAGLTFRKLRPIFAGNQDAGAEELGKLVVGEHFLPESLIDLRRIPDLIPLIRQWSGQMRDALPVFQRRDDPSDNVQVRIMDAARKSWRADDDNFTDLADFAGHVQADSSIPACAKLAIPAILTWIQSNVTFRLTGLIPRSQGRPRGLGIHLPAFRAHSVKKSKFEEFIPVEPHDLPGGGRAREIDGRSRRVSYASSSDALPLRVIDEEDGIVEPPLDPRKEWPRKPAPNFPFPVDSGWQNFLEALYHPKADNHIVEAIFGGFRILPTSRGGGECRNPNDEITVPVGAVVKLSGAGSSDADMMNGLFEPYTHMWDLNDRQPCRQQPCRGPHEVDPGADALRAATDNLDADFHIGNTLIDDLDARGPAQEFVCTEPGEWVTTLIVGDDDHLERHADTLPNAAHVHPQTGTWSSTIKCIAPGGTFVTTGGGYPFTETGVLVFGDHAMVAPAATFTTSARNFIPGYPFAVTAGASVTDLQVNGKVLADGTSNVVHADDEGVLRTRFTAGTAGAGSLRIQPLGLGVANLNFTAVNRLAPLPTDLQVTLPVGNVPVGADASLTLAVTRNGQPGADTVVTLWSPTSTATFVNGTLFRANTATQLRAGPTGRFLATFRAAANGPVHINIVAGQIFRSLTLNAAGGPRRDPTALQILPLAAPLISGREGSVVVRVLGVQLGLAGVTVRVEFLSGLASAPVELTTNAQGEATLRITPTGPEPIRLRATVPGTNLGANANLVVQAR